MINLFKFSAKNLYKKKLSFALLTIFLTIWFSLLILISIWKSYFTNIIDNYFLLNWVKNKIIVEKEDWTFSSLVNIWLNKSKWLLEKDIESIKKIAWVNNIYKYSYFKNTSVISLNLLWNYLETDAFFVWIEEDMIKDIIPEFRENNNNIPLIISSTAYNSIIDLFVKKLWTNLVSKDLLFKTNFNINFWKSLLLQSWKKNSEKIWKLVWFSDDVWLVFIWIPFNTLNKINLELTWENLTIDKLYIDIDKSYDQEVIQSKINNLWFNTSFSDDKANSIKSIINLAYIIILFFVYIFIWVIFYSIISFILLSLEQSKKDNAIMFSLWIDKKLISFIYFLEWFIISVLWIIFSLIIIKYSILKINNFIIDYNSSHFTINLPQIFIDYTNLFNLFLIFIWLNTLFISISSYKIFKTKYEEML